MSISNKLMSFLDKSHSNFHAVNEMAKMMDDSGYKRLKMNEEWHLDDKSKYYVLVNNSAVFAFDMQGYQKDFGYKIVASHTDAPTFKVKPNAVQIKNNYIIVNSEAYGGLIVYTWMDRPLKLAGRVIVKEEDNKLVTRLYDSKSAVGIIPSLAIHMNRGVNAETKFNRHTQMRPLLGQAEEFDFKEYLAKQLNVSVEAVIDYDLVFKPFEKAVFVGVNDEFIASNHLDNLQSAYLTFESFINSDNNGAVNVYASFDNEEIGSMTKQGAQATILKDILNRISFAMDQSPEQHLISVAKSFIVSADNAHANHPNYLSANDENHFVDLNGGVVIKYSANQKYTTDSLSAALMMQLSELSGARIQTYVNRADAPGGSTLGAISGTQISIMSVDIGLPQLAMHSSMELAGTEDNEAMFELIKSYYNNAIEIDVDSIKIKDV